MTKGWYATFSTVSKAAKNSSPQSALFKTSTDTIYSDTYFMAVNKIDYWVQAYNATGYFRIEAFNGEEWIELDSYDVDNTLRAQTKTITFEEKDNYKRFRMSYNHISGNGGLAFDDFVAYTSSEIIYPLKSFFYEGTTLDVNKLTPRTKYHYRVQATDADFQGRYENITEYSNQIDFETLEGGEDRKSVV